MRMPIRMAGTDMSVVTIAVAICRRGLRHPRRITDRAKSNRHCMDVIADRPQPDYFAAIADALRLRSGSLGFEAEMDGDRNVRGNGLAVPRCWFVLVFLQGFHRGSAQ